MIPGLDDTWTLILVFALPLAGAVFALAMPGVDRLALRSVGMGTSVAAGVVAIRAAWGAASAPLHRHIGPLAGFGRDLGRGAGRGAGRDFGCGDGRELGRRRDDGSNDGRGLGDARCLGDASGLGDDGSGHARRGAHGLVLTVPGVHSSLDEVVRGVGEGAIRLSRMIATNLAPGVLLLRRLHSLFAFIVGFVVRLIANGSAQRGIVVAVLVLVALLWTFADGLVATGEPR